ncbi:amino acid permease [Collinsella sp. zg1085]|uniref:amino acid permease n=1 Tax=Collinsella sp. zg1085 TaxID=2844380 RepID=UPI001C0D651C|nr:amino acid permease [Collinsella sp. zg1085]QWT18125.1 amino acid permease [Collinsella sp. zg1085]
MAEKLKGVGLFGLVGLVVSSCIGSGVFALTGQLAGAAAPGSALIGWALCGAGFLFLALSLANLGAKKPELEGLTNYATEGFGPFVGFISGWGYWLSAWLGNIGFGVMVVQVLSNLFPGVFAANISSPAGILSVVIVSAFLWIITFLVINGVESAAFLNAVVMIVKIASILLFIGFCAISFNAGVFTEDFWGTMARNVTIMQANDGAGLGDLSQQIINCLIAMMWVFIGIEGATVMSKRAAHKSDVGKATILGLIILLVLYIGASVLPYGVMPYEQLVAAESPATITVFNHIAPGWGGTFISIAIIISVLGSWLSFTMLPAETSSSMSDEHLLPASWNKMNKKNAPQMALIIVGACTQIFLIVAFAAADAYTFAISMCTVTIMISWALAAAYQVKLGLETKDYKNLLWGLLAVLFQVVCMALAGWQFLILACLGYIPGFFFYAQARKEGGFTLSTAEKAGIVLISIVGIISIPLTAIGFIPVF